MPNSVVWITFIYALLTYLFWMNFRAWWHWAGFVLCLGGIVYSNIAGNDFLLSLFATLSLSVFAIHCATKERFALITLCCYVFFTVNIRLRNLGYLWIPVLILGVVTIIVRLAGWFKDNRGKFSGLASPYNAPKVVKKKKEKKR